MYGTVEWCNMTDYMGKVKKSTDFENIVFVFKMGVVFLCCEKQKRRKSKVLVSDIFSSLPIRLNVDERAKKQNKTLK
jgi:hypothetical protein